MDSAPAQDLITGPVSCSTSQKSKGRACVYYDAEMYKFPEESCDPLSQDAIFISNHFMAIKNQEE